VISGPSGTGKGAICAGVTARTKMALSVSMTTRAPRENEKDGRDYFFVSKERFREFIEEGGFFEYTEVFGEYYGTPKAPVMKLLEEGTDVILEIEVNGAAQTRESAPDAALIFIIPPSAAELEKRITGRGTETAGLIASRLERADSEIAQVGKYDYCVVNDDLNKAVADVLAIIRSEKLRVGADAERIIKRYQNGAAENKKNRVKKVKGQE